RELKSRNRTAWNRYMADALCRERREELVNEGGCSNEEIVPFAVGEIKMAFSKRHKHPTSKASTYLPDLQVDVIDFSNIELTGPFNVEGFCFPKPVTFSGTNFSDEAIFERTTFCGLADFKDTTFWGLANFGSARFSDEADFGGTRFSNVSYFLGSKFHEV